MKYYSEDININAELWKEILKDQNICTDEVMEILVFLLNSDSYQSSGGRIAFALNYIHHAPLNIKIPNFSKRVLKKYPFINPPLRENGKIRYWNIPFLGTEGKGDFLWILRPELVDALSNTYPDISVVDYAKKVEQDFLNGKILNSLYVESKLQKLAPNELRNKAQSSSKKPKRIKAESSTYVRNPFVSAYAKQWANGICQLCDTSAPFTNRNGEPYLETHHIAWLSKGGDDTMENTVALCPNCHRKMHVLDLAGDKNRLEQKAKSLAQ